MRGRRQVGRGKALSAGYMSRNGLERASRLAAPQPWRGEGKDGLATTRCDISEWEGAGLPYVKCRHSYSVGVDSMRLLVRADRGIWNTWWSGVSAEVDMVGFGVKAPAVMETWEYVLSVWRFPIFQGRGFPPGQCPSPSYRPEREGNNQIMSAFHDESGVETRAWCCAPPPGRSSSARRATLLGLMLGGPVV